MTTNDATPPWVAVTIDPVTATSADTIRLVPIEDGLYSATHRVEQPERETTVEVFLRTSLFEIAAELPLPEKPGELLFQDGTRYEIRSNLDGELRTQRWANPQPPNQGLLTLTAEIERVARIVARRQRPWGWFVHGLRSLFA